MKYIIYFITLQANFEINGNSNPSLEKLLKIAKGLNADLKIDLIPKAIKI